MRVKSSFRANATNNRYTQSGFTLIELVVGIVIFAVAMVMVVSVIMPQARQGIHPIWQVRAVSLGQSLLSEITAKAFDEASITPTGRVACNDTVSCTESSALGADGSESRNTFDDIDDYNGLVLSGVDISNSIGQSYSSDISELFLGFSATVSVSYDDNFDGVNDDDLNSDGALDSGTLVGNQKRIEVVIYTPEGEAITFSSYRANF